MVLHQIALINRKKYPLTKHAEKFSNTYMVSTAQILFAANLSCPNKLVGRGGGIDPLFLGSIHVIIVK